MNTSLTLSSAFTRFAALALALASVGAPGGASLAQNQPPASFSALFNGRDLTGWRGGNTFDPAKLAALPPADRAAQIEKWTASMKAHWRVENGELVNDGEGDYATTEKDYGDFELWIEYKTVAGADSGIYLRGCPQVQIWDINQPSRPDQPDRNPNKGSGGLFNNTPGFPGRDPLVVADKAFGEWNQFRILMVASRVSVWFNHKLVVDHAILENYFDPDRQHPVPRSGPIQLQTHGGEIRWRNLFIREIAGEEAAKILRSAVKSKPDAVVYRGTYPGWPWVARTPGGRLVCVWREGVRHGFSAEGRLMLSTSDDRGRGWSKPRTFYDEPGIDDRNVAILTLSDTDWLVAFNTYTADNKSRVYTLRTGDGGQSWAQPQLICDFDARTRSAPLKLSSGELVLPFYREPNIQSFAAVSSDNGQSWKLVEIENHEGFLGDEWDACELPDGRLVGIIRNSAPKNDGTFYKTESRDHGRTWTRPVRTNLRDTRSTSPAQIFLHQGRPVVLYADARMVSVAMAVSDDPQLIRWNVDERVSCYRYREDGRPISDSSYPVSAGVGGNRRFIVDYQHDGDDHLVTGYFVDLPRAWNPPPKK